MYAASTVATASELAPKTRARRRAHTTSWMSPAAPDSANTPASAGTIQPGSWPGSPPRRGTGRQGSCRATRRSSGGRIPRPDWMCRRALVATTRTVDLPRPRSWRRRVSVHRMVGMRHPARRLGAILAALVLSGVPAGGRAAETSHDATSHHSFADVEHWKSVFDDPARAAWPKPVALVRPLELRPGMTVVDLGAGRGYFR